jgi:hypothetical protein
MERLPHGMSLGSWIQWVTNSEIRARAMARGPARISCSRVNVVNGRIRTTILGLLATWTLTGPAVANDPASANDVVVVMGTGAMALSKDQVANLYLGRDTDLKPLDLRESSAVRVAFYKKATGRGPAEVKAVWSRLMFTGQGQPPKEMVDAAAVKMAVAGILKPSETSLGQISTHRSKLCWR